jgi:hypothetical protein
MLFMKGRVLDLRPVWSSIMRMRCMTISVLPTVFQTSVTNQRMNRAIS